MQESPSISCVPAASLGTVVLCTAGVTRAEVTAAATAATVRRGAFDWHAAFTAAASSSAGSAGPYAEAGLGN